MARILCIGVNPAWQHVLYFPRFDLGKINRARRVWTFAAGKGVNTARALFQLGHEVRVLQVAGGRTGRNIHEDCKRIGVRPLTVWVGTHSRTCVTLTGGDRLAGTELIEPFEAVLPGAGRSELLHALLAKLATIKSRPEAVVYCGSIPAGIDASLYWRIQRLLQPRLSVADTTHGLRGPLFRSLDVLKINLGEWARLGRGTDLRAQKEGPRAYFITDGPGRAALWSRSDGLGWRLLPPSPGKVLNPIGAGDAVTAGITHFLLRGLALPEAARRAMGIGAASCLKPRPGEFAMARSRALADAVGVAGWGGVL